MAKEIVDKSEGCQFYSNMSHKPASALKTIPLVWPFAVWGLDMVGPFKTGTMPPEWNFSQRLKKNKHARTQLISWRKNERWL